MVSGIFQNTDDTGATKENLMVFSEENMGCLEQRFPWHSSLYEKGINI
jgi:hypothetical protein